jgi:DNA primase
VVGRKVQLKKAGREWKGLSPFTAEKTPSFYVNDQKGFYHCFSSGQHGDIFTFVIETEGLSFPEAVERLAAEAGVDLPRATPEAEVQETRRRGLHEVMELAATYFESQLSGRGGGAAREYLQRRSLGADTQRRFRIGLAPAERFALRDHLAGRDVSLELMAEAGLVITGEEIAVPYDRFRDRIIFPIEDGRGRVVAFGGRALGADAQAKYLNSPDTPLFSKGRLLYNQHRARGPAHDAGSVVAVEGYVDAIALSAIGVANVVAPLGTALTEDQLALMWRLADEAILCFDGDKAGRRAAYRALDVALAVLPTGKSLRFAILPEGQDPDDLARSGGRAAIEAVLAGARPLVDMLWAREIEAAPVDTPESRAAAAKRLRDAIAPIRDDTLKRFYRAEIEKRIDTLADDRRGRESQAFRGPAGRGRPWRDAPAAPLRASPGLAASALFAGASHAAPREALIVMILAAHPDLLDRYMGISASSASRVRRSPARRASSSISRRERTTRDVRFPCPTPSGWRG